MAKDKENSDFFNTDELSSLLDESFADNLAVPAEGAKTKVIKDPTIKDKKDIAEDVDVDLDTFKSLIQESTADAEFLTDKKDEVLNEQEASDSNEGSRKLETLLDIPVDVSVVLGKTSMSVSDLLLMGQGSIIELDKLLGDGLDVFVNGRPIARGSIVLSSEVFGCKLNHILSPNERLKELVFDN